MSDAFEVRMQPEAVEQFRALDPELRRRIREKLLWLAENAAEVRHLPLRDDLHSLFKRRVGSYRIIYQVVRSESLLVVMRIGDRRDIYELP